MMVGCAGNVSDDALSTLDAGQDAAHDAPKSWAPYTCHDGAVVRPNGAECTCANGTASTCADGACAC